MGKLCRLRCVAVVGGLGEDGNLLG